MKRILLALSGMVVGLGMNAQQINTYPHYTDFETAPQGPTGCGPVYTVPPALGWHNVTGTDNNDWTCDAGGTSSSTTGPSVDFDPGTSVGKYLYTETSCSGTGYPSRTCFLESDSINLNGTNAIQFEFAWHMYGSSMGTMHIDIDTTANGNWMNDVIPAWTNNVDQWFQTTVDLSPYTSNGFVKIRIRGVSGTSFGSDMAIDGLRLYDLLPDDAGISVVDSPSTPACNLGSAVWATVFNYGTDTLTSVNVDWEWNGAPQTTANFPTLFVLPGNDTSLFIGTAAVVNGDQLKLWTDQPNGVPEISSGAGNDTIWSNVQTGLSGTYTLGGPGANFPSFDSTVQALSAYGVCGPIVFNVYDSVYVEQISIPQIIGMSGINTVTYLGATDTTTLTFAPTLSTAQYTLEFDDADYFTFDNLKLENTAPTYRHVVQYQAGSNNNTIQNCTITQSQISSSTTTNYALVYSTNNTSEYNRFIDNHFLGGSYGMWYYGANTTTLSDGTVITGNTFENQYYTGIRIYYQDNTTIDNNKMHYTSTYTGTAYGIYGGYLDNELKITNNLIIGDTVNQGFGQWRWGVYLNNCDGTSSNHQLIANNMIANPDTVYTGSVYGIYLNNNGYQDVYHNSVCISNAGTNSRALYATGGGGSNLNNNIFANKGAGYAIYLNSGFTFTNVDYNNYYAPNGTMGYFTAAQPTLAGWQTASGFDANSYNVDPLFYSKWDLHTCADTLNNSGTPTLVNTDFDLEARTSTPDIGADEFATLTGNFLAADTAICPGDSIQIGMPGLNGTFAWSTGDSTATIWVSNPATYILTASSACGSGSDNIVITNLPLPVASFTQLVNFYTVVFTSTATNATSWWWDFGDGNTSTQQNPTHLYAWPGGTFNVTHVAYNNCGNDTSVISVTADESTGLADNAFAAGVSVYPNPAVGAFNISMTLNQGENVNVEVVSVTGAVVYSEALVGKQGTNVINVEKELASGSYFVRIRSEHNSAIKKLIIE